MLNTDADLGVIFRILLFPGSFDIPGSKPDLI